MTNMYDLKYIENILKNSLYSYVPINTSVYASYGNSIINEGREDLTICQYLSNKIEYNLPLDNQDTNSYEEMMKKYYGK